MRRSTRFFLIPLTVLTLSSSAARPQIEIERLNHYLCHKAKDSKFHPDKFPNDAGRDPETVVAVERIDVIHAGEHAFPLADRIRAVPLARLADEIEPLR